jgi:dihydroorotase
VVLDAARGVVEALLPPGEPVAEQPGDRRLDAAGRWVAPGFVELYASVPDPGLEHREDLASAAAAAARGGYTRVYTRPDTVPPVDRASVVVDILTRAARVRGARLVPHGAATVGAKVGEQELAPYGELREVGCRAIATPGDYPVASAGLMRHVLEYASAFDLPLIVTAVDESLGRGLCHEGVWSTRLGLSPSPAAAERIAVERDAALAELTGTPVHFARVSTAEGLAAVARAKDRGAPVTCSCTPHHLHLTAAALAGYDPNTRVWPPLRAESDVEALRAGLAQGVVDAVVSDHRPLHFEDKRREFMSAPAGISGIETALGLVLELVHAGRVSPERALAALSSGPAAVVGEAGRGRLEPGAAADVVVIDPAASWLVEPEGFASKGRNTPFGGRVMRGRVEATIVAGEVVWQQPSEAE